MSISIRVRQHSLMAAMNSLVVFWLAAALSVTVKLVKRHAMHRVIGALVQ